MGKDGLTGKQRAFIDAYLGEAQFNATEAARSAGYSGDANTLAVRGHELVRNSKVSEAIEARLSEAQMSADEVLSELAGIARADWKDFLTIKRNRDGEEVEVMLRLGDKLKALELVGKAHKLFTEKHEHTGADGGPLKVIVEYVSDSANPDN